MYEKRCQLCGRAVSIGYIRKVRVEEDHDPPWRKAVNKILDVCPRCHRGWNKKNPNGGGTYQGSDEQANRMRLNLVQLTGIPWSWSRGHGAEFFLTHGSETADMFQDGKLVYGG